jgi:ABC-2 type transport system permease protein
MSASMLKRFGYNASFVLALFARQLAASFALRAAFFTAAVAMLINDAMFFSTWWIVMRRFGSVRGWRLEDVMCLFGVSAGGFGICVILFGGIFDLARKVQDGELDTYMTQPKSVLLSALACRTQPSGWGDLVAAIGMFALSGAVTWGRLPWLVLALLCSAVAFTATGVVMHSIAFWLGRVHSLARSLWDFTVTFSLYPPPLFGGALRLVLFTLVPAGLVAYLPLEMFRSPSPLTLFAALGGTALYAAFASWVFERGTRRYSSGNRVVTGA